MSSPTLSRASQTGPPSASADPLTLGFVALVALTFGLIVLGALVRAHEAGLACPDWPTCFGSLIPEMDLQIAFEWTHRAVAGTVALIFAALAWVVWRGPAGNAQLRRMLAVAATLLGVQIVLGALTVWLRLASWTVTAHLLTGNAFAAALLLIALTLRGEARGALHTHTPRLARLTVGAIALTLLLQMTLGGLVSSQFAGMACPEWPHCNGGVFFPSFRGSVGLHLFHRLNGYALLLVLGVAAWVHRRHTTLRALTIFGFGLGLVQVVIGIANVLTGIPVEVTGLHSAFACALVLNTAAALRIVWSPQPAPPPPPTSSE
jgi:cytochrome c oxidase assembly protein subunit 15